MLTCIVPDVHVPFEQTAALMDWLKRQRPGRLVLLGDVLDFHAITEHPRNRKWMDRFDVEVRSGRRWLQNLRTVVGARCDIIFICGNHERRFERAISRNVPALRNLKHMTTPELLGLPDLGIVWHDVETKRKGVRVATGQGQVAYCFHGDELRAKFKGSVPLGYCAAYGVNSIVGHTHRYSIEHAAVGGRVYFGIEAGYLGNPLAPAFTYAGPAPKVWRRGFLVADAEQTHSPYPKWISA